MSIALVAELMLGLVLVSAATTGLVLVWLRRRRILDQPNERSSHVQPTPRGGGLAVVPLVAVAWLALAVLGAAPLGTVAAVLGAVGLAVISWRDDRGGLPVYYRLLAQWAAVVLGLCFLPGHGHVFQGLLPPLVDVVVTAVVWVWFVNLFNFMDGIDGLTGAETVAIGIGVALVAAMAAENETGAVPLGLVIAAVALGFLAWNWQPAKLFMGDVGSVPLGFLAGWLLLGLAGRGYWAPAAILPLYYLADATITLMRRAVRLERIWQAHREHFYQRAVQLGRSHRGVASRVTLANLGLIGLAVLGIGWPFVSVALAAVLVAALLVLLSRTPRVGRI